MHVIHKEKYHHLLKESKLKHLIPAKVREKTTITPCHRPQYNKDDNRSAITI